MLKHHPLQISQLILQSQWVPARNKLMTGHRKSPRQRPLNAAGTRGPAAGFLLSQCGCLLASHNLRSANMWLPYPSVPLGGLTGHHDLSPKPALVCQFFRRSVGICSWSAPIKSAYGQSAGSKHCVVASASVSRVSQQHPTVNKGVAFPGTVQAVSAFAYTRFQWLLSHC